VEYDREDMMRDSWANGGAGQRGERGRADSAGDGKVCVRTERNAGLQTATRSSTGKGDQKRAEGGVNCGTRGERRRERPLEAVGRMGRGLSRMRLSE
jgi:hypothetical protein